MYKGDATKVVIGKRVASIESLRSTGLRRFQVRQLCFSCGFSKNDELCLVENSDQLLIKYESSTEEGRTVVYYCGLSFREIGSRVGRNQTSVMWILDRWMQEGTTDRRDRSIHLSVPLYVRTGKFYVWQ
ncbi:hypothetical protein TNCV_2268871 [Trichonephila clavipes]|nr:hypothetical protein TNCV_2268871 [Trichonephila clavipes]